MSETLDHVRDLVASGRYAFSNHAYEELAADGILPGEILAGLAAAVAIEDYSDAGAVRPFWFSGVMKMETRCMPFGASMHPMRTRRS